MVSLTLEYQPSTSSLLLVALLTSQIKTLLLYQPGEMTGLLNPVRRQTSSLPWVRSSAPSGVYFGSIWEKCPQPVPVRAYEE